MDFYRALFICTIGSVLFAPCAFAQDNNYDDIKGVHADAKFKIVEGTYKFGDIIANRELEYGTTGIIKKDILAKGGLFSKDEVAIPAGTKVFAIKYKQKPYVYGKDIIEEETRTAVDWCGFVDTPRKSLNNGTGFCVPDSYKPNDKEALKKLKLQPNSEIATNSPSGSKGIKTSVYYAGVKQKGYTILSDVEVEIKPIEFTRKPEFSVLVRGATEKYVAIEYYTWDGDSLDFVSRINVQFRDDQTASLVLDNVKYLLKDFGTQSYTIEKAKE